MVLRMIIIFLMTTTRATLAFFPFQLNSDKRTYKLRLYRAADKAAIFGHGRNAGYPASAQIPACATNALGSSLGFWRQIDAAVVGADSITGVSSKKTALHRVCFIFYETVIIIYVIAILNDQFVFLTNH
jgi:hypothetical protein